MKKLFFTFALFGVFMTQASASCVVGHYKMIFKRDMSVVDVNASSGAPCSMPLHLKSKTWKTAGITEVILLRKPLHGTANAPLSANVSYQSKAGFKGIDRFAVRFCVGNPEGQRTGCSTLRYKINVS